MDDRVSKRKDEEGGMSTLKQLAIPITLLEGGGSSRPHSAQFIMQSASLADRRHLRLETVSSNRILFVRARLGYLSYEVVSSVEPKMIFSEGQAH